MIYISLDPQGGICYSTVGQSGQKILCSMFAKNGLDEYIVSHKQECLVLTFI